MVTLSASQAMRMLDADRSGGVSAREFKNGLGLLSAGVRQAVGATSVEKVFAAIDADSDQVLSRPEMADGLALLRTDTANALLAAQESQSPVAQMLSGLRSGAYSTLPGVKGSLATTSMAVLTTYAAWK